MGYHEYAAWKIRKTPEVIANGNAAEALFDVIHSIRFHTLVPYSWYSCMRTLSSVSSTVSLLLERGANPCSISIRPKDHGFSAWSYLVTLLTQCPQGHSTIDRYWAAVEISLQFGASLPIWSRNSEKSLSISLAEMSYDIETLKQGWFSTPVDFKEWFIPDVLKKIGGSATMVDFVSLHAPPNAERIFDILETRGL